MSAGVYLVFFSVLIKVVKTKSGLFASPMLMMLLPSIVLVALYYVAVVPLLNSMSSAESAEQYVASKKIIVDARISGLVDQLGAVAAAPSVIEAIVSADEARINDLNVHWRSVFPHADRFAILPYNYLGHAGMGELGEVLRNNIERDLVSKAVKKAEPQLDVYLDDGMPVVSVVVPVVDQPVDGSANSEKLGVIFMTLKQSWLSSLLHSDDNASQAGFTRLALKEPKRMLLAPTVSGVSLAVKAKASLALQALPAVQIEVSRESSSLIAPLMGAAIAAACAILVLVGLSLPKRREAEMIEKVDADADKLTQYIANTLREKVVEPRLNFSSNSEMAASLRKAIEQFKVDQQVQGSLQQQLGGDETLALDSLTEEAESSVEQAPSASQLELPAHIFRAYDVRGIADQELTEPVVSAIAKAFGTSVMEGSAGSIVVGRDGRLSSNRISEQVVAALESIGCSVIDIGVVPTPATYFAAIHRAAGNGIMVTASHNPAEDNGLKFLRNGQALTAEEIQALKAVAGTNRFASAPGSVEIVDIIDDYVDSIADDVVFASPVKVVVDCGNGAASEVAPILFAALGADVVPLYAEIDGRFPNRSPATRTTDLDSLCREVVAQGAELGVAFDGDADRLVAVTAEGKIVKGDHLLMLFAKDVLTRNPGTDVVFDVKCSKALSRIVTSFGGRPVMARSGHSWIKRSMHETGALLGGEFTGHFMFKERWFGFDDGLYAAARLIELLTLEGKSLSEALEGMPILLGTDEIEIAVEESEKVSIVEQFGLSQHLGSYDKSLLDGVRVDFPEGWGLLRASNTGAKLIARFEAQTQEHLDEIVKLFNTALEEINPALSVRL